MSASTIDIGGEPFILSVIRDISDARLATEEIRNLAYYDPLTRVANRRLLIDRLERSVSYISLNRGQRAFLSIDLDGFTTLNGLLGHERGDLLLREVAERITSCVREIDTVGRVGADEFFVIIESLTRTPQDAARNARAFAANMLHKISQPYDLDGYECTCTCCIGMIIFAENNYEVGNVLQQADLALSRAKAGGTNQICILVSQ